MRRMRGAGRPDRPAPPDGDRAQRLRVLVVDDHELFRRTIERLLATAGFDVVGGAADGHAALTAVAALEPDVVLLDVQLPDMDGFQVAAALADRARSPVVILTSVRDGAEFGHLVEQSTALAFVPKAELTGTRIRDELRR